MWQMSIRKNCAAVRNNRLDTYKATWMGIKNSKNRLTKKQTKIHNTISINFKFIQPDTYTVVVQSLSHVRLFATPWTTARQGSLSITSSLSLFKLMSVYTVNILKKTINPIKFDGYEGGKLDFYINKGGKEE